MQSLSKWTNGTFGIPSADTAHFKTGKQTIKNTSNTNTLASIGIISNGLSLDINKLNNGEAVTDEDYIVFPIYIEDIAAVNTALTDAINIKLSSDTPFATNNYIVISKNTELVTGWNFIKIKRSTIITAGSPDLSNIRSMAFSWQANANMINKFVSIGEIQLVKKDPLEDKPNPFQKYGKRDFSIYSGEWFVGKELGKIVWKEISMENVTRYSLIGQREFKNFVAVSRRRQDSSVRSIYGITWFYNTLNYIVAYIHTDILYLDIVENGVSKAISVPFLIDAYDTVEYRLEKYNENVRLCVSKNNDPTTLTILKNTTVIEQGVLSIGHYTHADKSVDTLSITELGHAHHADVSEVAKKLTSQPVARVYNNANQSIATAVATAITFNAKQIDNRDHFDINNPTKLTIRESGIYRIDANVSIQNNATGTRQLIIRLNGTTAIATIRNTAINGEHTELYCGCVYELKEGDYIEMIAFQNSGSALNVYYAPYCSPLLSLAKIG